ncbi:hypothetical protein A2291_03030 [candidate division WOR-1 bacterium RIFOXYB2_FULL_42_35]|uniref:Polymerase nucleotidyl transferase domain-containing protein n=1 Tax=candidate division WOR-1 bacterium RIFOXYC2_FULL_41_25 TaxID=1802586 RepID=A0A1F4TSU9_UNCSA|nr:MAG: hypothetical protein A2247_01340 [candidate division WOR-1 bacterium RIFOXYA2_FULL_41_14]OGC25741.1 MAG: hypothetical protein A2291_03030 [candidate division WOR-1 bacterium RIFOXYB2_FULL_42_35]OGC35143.1 MAG: hypothetical protein A2462_06175 [candidate division WOR-1 bacterium RIFOXYC2_FULL_41_25]OGC42207.1 MAG: hypothetical protein A2548_03600 [candidate division WOR-1 bacterium RIFOXYD2_FULL_41_8]
MWLWGSYAYGQPNENSDLDIALVSKEFDKYRFIKRGAEVAKQLKTWSDKELPDIDFLCYTPQEFAKKKKEVSLVRQIIQKGIRLV